MRPNPEYLKGIVIGLKDILNTPKSALMEDRRRDPTRGGRLNRPNRQNQTVIAKSDSGNKTAETTIRQLSPRWEIVQMPLPSEEDEAELKRIENRLYRGNAHIDHIRAK